MTDACVNSISEDSCGLVREDRMPHARERLEMLLLHGLESGEPIDVTEDYVQQKRAKLMACLQVNQKRGS